MKLVLHSYVYHVGRPDRTAAGGRSPSSGSQEGIGVSVSMHPEAWIRIAKLGGKGIYTLRRKDRVVGRFAAWAPSLQDRANRWGVAVGLLVPKPVFVVEREVSDEGGDIAIVSEEYATKARAEAAVAYYGGDFEDGGARVREVGGFASTATLSARWRAHFSAKRPSADEAQIETLNLYMAVHHARLDGIWWQERLDPDNYSAPRGVILPHAYQRWSAEPVKTHEPTR